MTLTLNTVKQFFCITLWLMMLHHHTRYGNKMFCGSEDIIQQTFNNILNLHCDLDFEHSNPIFPQDMGEGGISDTHAALKGPEAADVDNKACIEAFQQLLSNSPRTQKITFSLCSASRVEHFDKRATDAEHPCTLCFSARKNTLANWLTVVC